MKMVDYFNSFKLKSCRLLQVNLNVNKSYKSNLERKVPKIIVCRCTGTGKVHHPDTTAKRPIARPRRASAWQRVEAQPHRPTRPAEPPSATWVSGTWPAGACLHPLAQTTRQSTTTITRTITITIPITTITTTTSGCLELLLPTEISPPLHTPWDCLARGSPSDPSYSHSPSLSALLRVQYTKQTNRPELCIWRLSQFYVIAVKYYLLFDYIILYWM